MKWFKNLFKKKEVKTPDVIVVDGGLKRISYDRERRLEIAKKIWAIPLGRASWRTNDET